MAPIKKIRAARSLRQRETEVERRLWAGLRNRRIAGFKFRRQHPIGPYVADLACPEAKLVIEIDGYWHWQRIGQDNLRTDRLRSFGYEVVRFQTDDAAGGIDPLIEAIVFAVRERIKSLQGS